ncbi:MAG: hypothetical protein AAF467_22005 [Actinomycetota bacterium]
MQPHIVHEDAYGSLIDYPDDDYFEVRWYDASVAFTGGSFNERLTVMADAIERCGRSGLLVDAVQFGMRAEDMDVAWRNANHIPRLNAAGVKKEALIVPAGFPPIGAPPAPDGPADYPSAFFATRGEARSWLSS